MAKNNGNMVPFNGEFDGSKIKGKINRRLLEFILTISLSASLSGCTINEDVEKNNESENVKTPSPQESIQNNKLDESLSTDEKIEIVDEYVRYIESTPSNKSTSLSNIKDLIKEQYEKGKEKYEESGAKEKVEKEKEEFFYSMNELINMTQEKLIQEGIVPFDAYEEDYVENDKFLKDDKVNKNFDRLETYMNIVDERSGAYYKQLKIWFFGTEQGKDYATEDSVYKKLLKFKDDYLTERSTPYMTEKDLEILENKYINHIEKTLDKINKSLEKYGINIPMYVNYTEDYEGEYTEEFTEEMLDAVETFKLI